MPIGIGMMVGVGVILGVMVGVGVPERSGVGLTTSMPPVGVGLVVGEMLALTVADGDETVTPNETEIKGVALGFGLTDTVGDVCPVGFGERVGLLLED